ncbi:MAG: CBS domain-containing protein [Rubricoccaceae bacterium]|nr:CBS domain-containing protein [Rubricoccaceae bacterium]
MNTPVSALLKQKGDWVITIDPDATVYTTIARMVDQNVGAILVAERGEPVGIFTERDYLRRIVLQGRTSRETAVRDVMTTDLVTVEPDTTLETCMAIMTERKIRHLPVIRDGRLAGVISIGDCVRAISEAARGQAEDLQRFVTGGYPS